MLPLAVSLALLATPALAPVPRCSPLIIINKVPDSTNLLSDLSPYFPVPPCEYGGPLAALRAGDYEVGRLLDQAEVPPSSQAVFGPRDDNLPLFPGQQLARHNILEGLVLLTRAAPRIGAFLRGEQELKVTGCRLHNPAFLAPSPTPLATSP